MREEGCETFWWEWPTRPSLPSPSRVTLPANEDKIATSRKEERRACHLVQGREGGSLCFSPFWGP